MVLFFAVILLGCSLALFYRGQGFWAWFAPSALGLVLLRLSGCLTGGAFIIAALALLLLGAVFYFPALRRKAVSGFILSVAQKASPRIGKTEQIALDAGTVWWDGELFSGKPDWRKLLSFPLRQLTPREQDFLDGQTEELCRMLNDWQIAQDRDLSPEIWEYMKKHRFFGMIIPESYGGLGFSAMAHSAVVAKIASRSVPAAVTVMVPNSLGPGELLMHFGTEEQKNYYLPRLAIGEEIPCFALTEPTAGSDAANGRSTGVVCQGSWQGKTVTGIRLNFSKRYITLAPVASVIGLAFHLYDPEHLLGKEEDLGITCALLPRDIPGMKIGKRHDPMGVPFQNGPIQGHDVFIPVEFIIGGAAQAGNGWRMLMEALAAGRSISLPSLSVGAAELAARTTSAYAQLREQFSLPIGKFEGVRARLARIAGHAYFMNAARVLTCSAVDSGERPSVSSAIVKAYLTEGMRLSLNDAMDIQAGAAICRGPNNIFARPYASIPIGITVEGANILTRSLIVFGQGAIRCHPFLRAEMESIQSRDLSAFDRTFFSHLNHIVRNAARALFFALGGQCLAPVPPEVAGDRQLAGHYRRLTRLSAAFALIADISLITLGGALKRKEHLSGRLADAFAWLYLSSAALKRFHHSRQAPAERPFLEWTMATAYGEIVTALRGVLRNLPNRLAAGLGCALCFPFGARADGPTDRQVESLVNSLLGNEDMRNSLTGDIFIPVGWEAGLGKMESALQAQNDVREIRHRLEHAWPERRLTSRNIIELAKLGEAERVISSEECHRLIAAEALRDEIIQVNAFDPDEYKAMR